MNPNICDFKKAFFMHYSTDSFISFICDLLFSSVYNLKMLSHLRTQANVNRSPVVSFCRSDEQTQIYSTFSLIIIDYMSTGIDDSNFYSNKPREWAVILMCLTW